MWCSVYQPIMTPACKDFGGSESDAACLRLPPRTLCRVGVFISAAIDYGAPPLDIIFLPGISRVDGDSIVLHGTW